MDWDGGDVLVAFGLLVLLAFFIFILGGVYQSSRSDEKCKGGHPIVIDNKVYRCVVQS